jgi:hypothetical protein
MIQSGPLLTLPAMATLSPSFRATPSPSEVPLPSPRSPSFGSHASQSCRCASKKSLLPHPLQRPKTTLGGVVTMSDTIETEAALENCRALIKQVDAWLC